MDDDVLRVEAACMQLLEQGQPVTFGDVAILAQTSRTTLYRRPDLRVLVEEHRSRGREANTLSGLAIQVDQLRNGLEAVAANVRRHEEALRRLQPRGKKAKAG